MNDTTTASPLAASTCPSEALPTLPEILLQDCPVDWWETSPIDFSGSHDYGDDRHLRFAWMSQLPRFGFPDDIGHVRTEDWQSYVNGLASMAAFTSVLFVLWWTVLVACKCTGKGGFLSGTLTTTSRPAHIKACRYVVVLSGVLVWIFSVLLVTKALESLKGVIALVQETLPLAEEILHEAGNATTAFLEAAGKSKAARIDFFDNISEHCEFAFPRAEQAVVRLNDTLTKLGGFGIGARLEGISNTIVDTQGVLDMVEDYLDVTRESLVYVVVIAVVVIDLMVLLFLVTTGLRWWADQQKQKQKDQEQDQDLSDHPYTKALHTLQKLNCCLLPTFGFTLVFTYVFSIVSMVTSQLVSDVCVGDVDETIKAVVGAPPVATALLSWYVGGCLWSTRPGYVPTILNEVVVPSLQQIMEFGKTWLNQTGIVGTVVSGVVETVGETVTDVVDAVVGVVDNVGDGAIVEEALSTALGAGQEMLNDTLSNVVGTVTDVVGGAVGEAQNWVNETVSTVTNVVDTVTSTVEGVQGMVNETVSNVAGSVANVVGSVTDAVGGAQEMVNQTVSGVAGTVETVSNVVGTVQSVSNAAGMGPVETVSTVVDTVQTASNVAGAVADVGGGNGLVDQAVSSVIPGERLLQQVLENLANQVSDNLPNPVADRLPDSLGIQCGFGVQAIEKSWTFLQAKFVSVLRLGLGLLKVLNCGRIHTIYYRLIHELTCEQGLTAMGQVFLWLFLLTFFSMVMVTCRAAWNPIVEANTLPLAEEEKQDQGAVVEDGGRIEPGAQKGMLVSGTKSTNYIADERVPEDTNGTLEASGTGITMGTFSVDGTEVRVSLDGTEEDEEEVEA